MKHRIKGISAFVVALMGVILVSSLAFADELGGIDKESADGPEKGTFIHIADIAHVDSSISLGEEVLRSFSISCRADECFVRLKAHLERDDRIVPVSYAPPIEDGWICGQDGWWYHKEPLAQRNVITFTSSFVLDGSGLQIDKQRSSTRMEVSEVVTADAIQLQDVDPDWNNPFPWGGLSGDAEDPPAAPDSTVDGSDHPGSDRPDSDDPGLSEGKGDDSLGVRDLSSSENAVERVSLTLPSTGSNESPRRSDVVGSLPQTGDKAKWLVLIMAPFSILGFILLMGASSLRRRGFSVRSERDERRRRGNDGFVSK